MKLELYLVPEDIHGKALKLFLTNIENSGNYATFRPEFSNGQFGKTGNTINQIVHNNLKFDEIITSDLNFLSSIAQMQLKDKISLLRIKRSHSIGVQVGFNENFLNQLLEHIKKYNLKTYKGGI